MASGLLRKLLETGNWREVFAAPSTGIRSGLGSDVLLPYTDKFEDAAEPFPAWGVDPNGELFVRCKCGMCVHVPKHTVDKHGEVRPSLWHDSHGCGWHIFAKLLDWDPKLAPKHAREEGTFWGGQKNQDHRSDQAKNLYGDGRPAPGRLNQNLLRGKKFRRQPEDKVKSHTVVESKPKGSGSGEGEDDCHGAKRLMPWLFN